MSDGPNAGNIIAGIFLILLGLCLTLLGGGCTVMWFFALLSSGGSGMGDVASALPLVLISLVVLGAGIVLLWVAGKLMTGRIK